MKQLVSLLVFFLVLHGCRARAQEPPHDYDDCPPGLHWSEGRCKSSVRVRFGTNDNQQAPAFLSSPLLVTSARPLLQSGAIHLLNKDKCLPGYKQNKQGVCKASYLHPLQWFYRLNPLYAGNSLNQFTHGLNHPYFAYLPFLYNALSLSKGINSLPYANRFWGYLNYGSLFPYRYHGLSICPPGYQVYRGKCQPYVDYSLLHHV
ncbi:uncharacterized protein LOC135936816 [Cloeon dipterum]|uniref:uncharacterized protein LOC135936816 n=1 Tax=Cloeon dipterum TaxID=197152 RepID=UPI0032204C26